MFDVVSFPGPHQAAIIWKVENKAIISLSSPFYLPFLWWCWNQLSVGGGLAYCDCLKQFFTSYLFNMLHVCILLSYSFLRVNNMRKLPCMLQHLQR